MMDQQRNMYEASAVLYDFQSYMLSLPSWSTQPSTSTTRYDYLVSHVAQHGTVRFFQLEAPLRIIN